MNAIGVSSSPMSGVKVKTLSEIKQERKRVRADTHDAGMPKRKPTDKATAVQMDQATGQSHAQQLGVKKSESSLPPRVVPPAPASVPTVTTPENRAEGIAAVAGTAKPMESQCAEDILLSSTSTNPPSEDICTSLPGRAEAGSGALAQVQKQAARVKIRKPSMGPEAKPSLSPDVAAIENIKSAIQLDR